MMKSPVEESAPRAVQRLILVPGLLGLALLSACDDSKPVVATAEPPRAVKEAVTEFAGQQPTEVSYLRLAGSFTAEFTRPCRRYLLRLDPSGGISEVVESLTYRPYVPTPRDRQLARLEDAAEDIVDSALANDKPGQAEAIEALTRAATTEPLLAVDDLHAVRDLLESVRVAQRRGDDAASASAAASLMRKAIEQQDGTGSPVPKALALLDNDGLRLKLLATARTLDVPAAKAIIDDVVHQYASLRAALPDKHLAVLLDALVARLPPALDRTEPRQLAGLADELLAALDLAEQAYQDAGRRPPSAGCRQTP